MSEAIEGEIVNAPTPAKLTKHPEETVQKLEAAFHNGYNITEACQWAEISRETFYNWLEDDDAFSYRMSVAQGAVNRKAKEIVVAGIKAGDAGLALRYLTLRDPDFKPKASLDIDPELEKTREKIKEFLDEPNDGSYNAVSTEPATTDGSTSTVEMAQPPTDIS